MKPVKLADLLAPYRRTNVAQAISVHKNTVHIWAQDLGSPQPALIPALAEFLRIPAATLAEIVANDRKRRSLEKFAESA